MTDMNATELTQIITAVGTLIGVLVTAILTLRNGWKTDIVAAHVNSSATKAQEEIRALQARIEVMRLDLADKKEIAALLASKIPIPIGQLQQASSGEPQKVEVVNPEPQKVEVVNEPANPVPILPIKVVK